MKTTDEWRRLGQDDPLYAVAAHEGARGAWDDEAFYGLGRQDWSDFEARWRQYEPSLGGTAVEIGCGAGRITHRMTDVFDRVVGLDVSPEMIERAKKVAPTAEFRNVNDTRVPLADDTADAVFTCHVLQHLENLRHVTDYLFDCRRVLRPGGTIMVHLLLHEGDRPVAQRAWAEVKLAGTRALRANRGAYSRVRRYRPDEVRAAMGRAGFSNVELREFQVSSNNDPHAFWFGRA